MSDFTQREFDEHPSLTSLDDFDPSLRNSVASMRASPAFELPSQHSGFRSSRSAESEYSDSESAGPWSPPAWRKPASGWCNPADRLAAIQSSPARSRHSSHDLDADLTLSANLPLPESPEKRSLSPSPGPTTGAQEETIPVEKVEVLAQPQNTQNYIRFAVRAEVQHRTEPIEAIVTFVRYQYRRITSSRLNVFSFSVILFVAISIARGLLSVQDSGPGPDLVKIAGLARSFEPLIHYSENGAMQIGALQETGVAVWDLGESVRYSNMTSSPIIVKELDSLSESLKTLAVELTRFFANVDGDIDSILIVMEWAKRELTQVSSHLPTKAQSVYSNLHAHTHRIGGDSMTTILTSIFGLPHSERTKATLQRTFNEFLNVLEESINSELHYSNMLFGLFEAIDRQFLNLQRTVLRETDTQEAEKERADSELADLWRRAIGGNKSRIHKFEKNKALLASIRGRTVQNKITLEDHNGKLLKLKANLEILRKRLVSPLLRSNESSTLSVAEQIRGLDGTYDYLRGARERQKSLLMERLYGAARRSSLGVGIGGDGLAIEAGSEH